MLQIDIRDHYITIRRKVFATVISYNIWFPNIVVELLQVNITNQQ